MFPDNRTRSPSAGGYADAVGSRRSRLIDWFADQQRDLPWRETDDPYAIWVSEIMLQQTRVETVIPYYEQWMTRFPTVSSLAGADEDEVLRHWQGLGYYARARNLHRAAAVVLRDFHGEVPRELNDLRSLPGVGRYTAGAIASIAFRTRTPAVDGNVKRVAARIEGIEAPIDATEATKTIWQWAADLAEHPNPGNVNQALMELGAVVCTPKHPRCPSCPVGDLCRANATGRADSLPRKSRRPRTRDEHHYAYRLIDTDGRVLVARQPTDGLLGGTWLFPTAPVDGDPTSAWRARHAGALAEASIRGDVEHVFTHIRMRLTLVDARPKSPVRTVISDVDEVRWARDDDLSDLPRSTLMTKLIRSFGD